MELIPVASAVVGLLGGIVRLLNATGVSKSPKGGKGGIDNPDAKLTLTPPLFERHNDRNASVHSPLDAFDLHRQALFSNFMADGHALIATAQLQPTQQNYHDVMARVRLPAEAVSVWPFAAQRFSAPPSYYAATQSSTPVLDALVRIQPTPAEPTFLQVKLSSDRGGVADAIGCYKLPLDSLFATTRPALRPSTTLSTSTSSIQLQPAAASKAYTTSTGTARPFPATPTSASPASTASTAVTATATPQLALFFAAPVFESSPAVAAPAAPASDEHKPAVGLRVDHLGTSLGVRVDPLDPSSQVSGWLASSTYLSADANAALRGGMSFTTGVNALPPGSSASASSLSGMAQSARVDGKLFYTQMVDVDTDERYSTTVVRSPVPAYEIGVTLRNGGEELVTSFYNHTTVRRRVYNPLEKKNVVGMHNYLDIGLELAMRRQQQPAWRLATAWQLNKNTLLKCRVSDTELAAALALKSWHTPNTTASAAVHYDYKGNGVRVGLSVAVDNVGSVLFGRAPVGYTRVINAKQSDVTYQYSTEQDY